MSRGEKSFFGRIFAMQDKNDEDQKDSIENLNKQNKIGKGEVSEKLGHQQLCLSPVYLQVQDIRETGLGRR
jgi:hypothetical protein